MKTGQRLGRPVPRNLPTVNGVEPEAGLYRMRLARGAVWSAIRIWYGPPLDPVTGEELDRSWNWRAHANGAEIELDRVWPSCAKEPIDQREYDHLMRTIEWGKKHAPDSPQANPRKPADMLKSPLLF